jgi:type I restriction enzyme S subunit
MTHLPNSWQPLTLGDVAHWTSGGTPSSKNSDFYDGDIPWVCIGDLNEGLVLETAKKITKAGLDSSSAKIMPKGTVMLAMYATSIGDTGMMETDMATNQAIACGVPITEIVDGKYLLYYLQSQKHEFFAAGRGGAQPNINQGIVKGWPIPVPPIAEQHKIVELLENHLSRLDAALADVKQAKIMAAQFRRSLLQAAFTGNLALSEPNLRTEIPGEWRQKRFGDIFKVKYGKAIDKSLRMEFAEFPVVGSAGIMTYTKTPLTSEPTIVIGRKGNVGSIQIFKAGCYPIDTTYYMPTISDFDIDFLTYQLTSLELVKLDSSTATPSLRREDLENVQVVIPPIEEQLKIVALIKNHLSMLDSAVQSADAMEKQSTGLRRSLLQAAFTGQLTKEVVSV